MPAKHKSKKVGGSAAKRASPKKRRRPIPSELASLDELLKSADHRVAKPQPGLPEMLELAATLKRARRKQRLSLATVASRTGIDKAALSRLENGKNLNPTLGTLKTIAQALGVQLQFRVEANALPR
jgi:DNA-binding Xre family transcriptional regulator